VNANTVHEKPVHANPVDAYPVHVIGRWFIALPHARKYFKIRLPG